MKVNRTSKVEKIGTLVKSEKKSAKESAAGKSGLPEDAVEITSSQIDLRKIEQKMKEIPEVRAEKVEKVKNELHGGQYQLRPEEIAEELIQEALEKRSSHDE